MTLKYILSILHTLSQGTDLNQVRCMKTNYLIFHKPDVSPKNYFLSTISHLHSINIKRGLKSLLWNSTDRRKSMTSRSSFFQVGENHEVIYPEKQKEKKRKSLVWLKYLVGLNFRRPLFNLLILYFSWWFIFSSLYFCLYNVRKFLFLNFRLPYLFAYSCNKERSLQKLPY